MTCHISESSSEEIIPNLSSISTRLQEDPTQQQILESAKMFRIQHDMSVGESIRQADKLRKDLFEKLWPNQVIDKSRNDRGVEEEEEDMEEAEEKEEADEKGRP